MPLIKGCSIETCKENYEELLKSGKPGNQAFAIAINTAKKYRRMCSPMRQKEIMEGKIFGKERR